MTVSWVILRCSNIMCRVETFKGTSVMPLNCCPTCQTLGSVMGKS